MHTLNPSELTAEAYWLPKLRWEVFGTLTFIEERLSEAHRLSRFYCVLRRAAQWGSIHFRDLLWVLRQENGDAFGRRHFHFVIGGLDQDEDIVALCRALERCWTKKRGGDSRIEPFDPNRDGIGYLLKDLNFPSRAFRPSAKFTLCDGRVMQSSSVDAFLRRQYAEGREPRCNLTPPFDLAELPSAELGGIERTFPGA